MHRLLADEDGLRQPVLDIAQGQALRPVGDDVGIAAVIDVRPLPAAPLVGAVVVIDRRHDHRRPPRRTRIHPDRRRPIPLRLDIDLIEIWQNRIRPRPHLLARLPVRLAHPIRELQPQVLLMHPHRRHPTARRLDRLPPIPPAVRGKHPQALLVHVKGQADVAEVVRASQPQPRLAQRADGAGYHPGKDGNDPCSVGGA